MSATKEFDEWAERGKDKGMERRHWNTAKHVLARMPTESGDTVLDLGTGSGYALRALRKTGDIGYGYGIDASPEMLRNAVEYTDDSRIEYLRGEFCDLPFGDDEIDHAFSMEAFYYAKDLGVALEELCRVLCPGGTFYCAVNFFKESEHTHHWQDTVSVDMELWSTKEYRDAFRRAGHYVAEQDNIPDRETEIPPEEDFPVGDDEFPIEDWEKRKDMVDRYRRWGTLLTVGVSP